jgi:aminoglycoside 2'-N-acetyltransferase I
MVLADTLQIKILSNDQISPELDKQIDQLDHLAYSSVKLPEDPEYGQIVWSAHDWMVLGFLNDTLVTQLCLLKREINVGTEAIWIYGLGGVATDPQWQRHGFALQILREAEKFMRNEIRVAFGLLICDQEIQSHYTRCGWINVAQSLRYSQAGQSRILNTSVMILPLTNQAWPSGEIDLRGSPW